jgi:hypothetical protein
LTSDDRLLFIALRKREIDLARAMVKDPDNVPLWNEWHTAAVEVDKLYVTAEGPERQILDDLNKMLRVVYPGVMGIEQLIGAGARCSLSS